jgi:catechol 2,3-dioxygenase-like lactoylglutathione lyase family enzyme
MIPKLTGIDHVHVYVHDREQAGVWYQEMLGFQVSKAFEFWAEDANGPLTIEDASGTIHLALFTRSVFEPSTAIAFNTSGAEFLK